MQGRRQPYLYIGGEGGCKWNFAESFPLHIKNKIFPPKLSGGGECPNHAKPAILNDFRSDGPLIVQCDGLSWAHWQGPWRAATLTLGAKSWNFTLAAMFLDITLMKGLDTWNYSKWSAWLVQGASASCKRALTRNMAMATALRLDCGRVGWGQTFVWYFQRVFLVNLREQYSEISQQVHLRKPSLFRLTWHVMSIWTLYSNYRLIMRKSRGYWWRNDRLSVW
jgi:hypothetical protein